MRRAAEPPYLTNTLHCRQSAFTLLELLVVIAIIAMMAGLIASLPASDRRHAAVRSAAEDLAATLRLARTMAMDQRMVCGVAFNITNGAGTSGSVLNNWDGGHWYRIIGPVEVTDNPLALAVYPKQPFNNTGGVSSYLRRIQESWLGDKHVLPPRKVRFLALGDQDNGSPGWQGGGRFPATYPRPWFGWWEQGTGRLRSWGGYDHDILDHGGRPCSAFYFAGNDGPLVDSRSPADRFTTVPSEPLARVHTAGEPRAVVNGSWLDYVIEFLPDGSVRERMPMEPRRNSVVNRGTSGYQLGGTGWGDLGDHTSHPSGGSGATPPITSYIEHTGVWSLTLAPDATRDSDQFDSARSAFESISPAYRVTINPFGDVRVVRVSRVVPAGMVMDTTSITDWQSTSQINARYKRFIATNNDSSGTIRGMPVSNFLTPEILAGRQWWMVAP